MCHWSGAWQRREVEEKPPEVVSSVTAAFKSVHVSGTCCGWHLQGVRSAVPGAQLGKYNVPSAGPPPAAFGAKREMVITRSASKNRYLVRIFPKHSKDCVVRSGWATATGHQTNGTSGFTVKSCAFESIRKVSTAVLQMFDRR